MKNELKDILESVSTRERQKWRSTLLLTSIPFIAGIVFLLFTGKQISEKNAIIEQLEQKRVGLKSFVDSLKADSTTRYATGIYINILSSDTSWNHSNLIFMDSSKVVTSMTAYQLIKEMKNDSIDFNKTSIRYYPKKGDQDKLLTSLALSGFKWIFVNKKNYDSKINSNVMHYSEDVGEEEIKLAALSFLRAGLDLKIIDKYSTKYARNKKNSIEIAGYSEALKLPPISVDSIMRFHKGVD